MHNAFLLSLPEVNSRVRVRNNQYRNCMKTLVYDYAHLSVIINFILEKHIKYLVFVLLPSRAFLILISDIM